MPVTQIGIEVFGNAQMCAQPVQIALPERAGKRHADAHGPLHDLVNLRGAGDTLIHQMQAFAHDRMLNAVRDKTGRRVIQTHGPPL